MLWNSLASASKQRSTDGQMVFGTHSTALPIEWLSMAPILACHVHEPWVVACSKSVLMAQKESDAPFSALSLVDAS